ncbi:MAG: protein-disulfide reductase DsbD family protein [Puia sp.]|nr:protein-disulfide reductase DsbD family protein [Puia sp.]
MIRILFLLILLGMQRPGVQAQEQAHWTYAVKPIGSNRFEVHVTAALQPGWHIYAQHQVDGFSGIPTHIDFTDTLRFSFEGTPREEGHQITEIDPNFGIRLFEYESRVDFVQVVQINPGNTAENLDGLVKYQLCSHTECLQPQTVKFTVALNPLKPALMNQ